METIKQEVQRVARGGQPFVVGMLDVDHFKAVNDRYGHEAGDRALVELARVRRHGLREYDLCGRWGGEEFLVLLPNTGPEAAQAVMDRLVGEVRAMVIDVGGEALRLTVSIGMSCHQLGETFSETLSRADQALYLAKQDGRDRVALGYTPALNDSGTAVFRYWSLICLILIWAFPTRFQKRTRGERAATWHRWIERCCCSTSTRPAPC